VNIWTAQHEQYLARTHAALQAAGYPADNLQVLVCESTQLHRDGASSETELTLNEALKEIDGASLRFLWLLPEWNEFVAIKLDKARRDDESNPAYAARLLPSRLKTLADAAAALPEGDEAPWSEAERQLARLVALWPDEATQAALERRPQRVARFVLELAEVVRLLLTEMRPNRNTAVELLRAGHVVAVNALRTLGIEARNQF
jgi:arginyl-tRNA synthetase